MPTVSGTSILGVQNIATGLTAATTGYFNISSAGRPAYQYWGYLEHVQNVFGGSYAGVDWGLPVWNIYYLLSIPSISPPNSRTVRMSWRIAGVDWSFSY